MRLYRCVVEAGQSRPAIEPQPWPCTARQLACRSALPSQTIRGIGDEGVKRLFGRIRDRAGQWLHRLAQWVGGRSYGGPTVTARLSVTTPDIRSEEYEIEPSRPYAGDWLGHEEFGTGLSRLTQYGSGSGVVLVDGSWGCGKTTFVRMWAATMRNEGRTVVEVNAWTGDYADSPFDDIVKQFGRGLREQHKDLRSLVAAIVGMTAAC